MHSKKRELRGSRGWMARMSRNKASKAAREGESPIPDPFGVLAGLGELPAGPGGTPDSARVIPVKTSQRGQPNTNRGRVDIVRQTAHRGGKGVTVARNFTGISLAEKQELVKKMQK